MSSKVASHRGGDRPRIGQILADIGAGIDPGKDQMGAGGRATGA